MGQYHYVVNLDKKEFINPHVLGTGLKLWEQLANFPGTGQGLIVLLACSNGRGGGDFRKSHVNNEQIVGRWAGDRIAIVGDYAEDGDLPKKFRASTIYGKCHDTTKTVYNDNPVGAAWKVADGGPHDGQYVHDIIVKPAAFRDIYLLVVEIIEKELGGRYTGDGWRHWEEKKS